MISSRSTIAFRATSACGPVPSAAAALAGSAATPPPGECTPELSRRRRTRSRTSFRFSLLKIAFASSIVSAATSTNILSRVWRKTSRQS